MACRFPTKLLIGGNPSSTRMLANSCRTNIGVRYLRTGGGIAKSRHHRRLSKRQRQLEQEKAAKYDLKVALQRIHGIMAASEILNTNDDDDDSTLNDLVLHYPHLSLFLRMCATNGQVLPSTIGPEAGRGLFATRHIAKGEIVTLYPAHLLGLEINNHDNNHDEEEDVSLVVFSSQDDQDYFAANNYESECGNNLLILDDLEGPETANAMAIEIITRPSMMITSIAKNLLPQSNTTTNNNNNNVDYHLDVNPLQPLVPGWQSHIINDGARASSAKESDILQYYLETNQKRNCFHIPLGPSPLMATVATRDIDEGEEYFTSYDFLYWVVDARSQEPPSSTTVDHQDNDDDKGSTVLTDAIEQQTNAMDDALWEATLGVGKQYEGVVSEFEMYFDQIR